MKNLTTNEFFEAPALVQWIYTCAINNAPIGSSTHEEAIEKHPEYFLEEVEHRRKWASVPEELKEKYYTKHRQIEKDYEARGPKMPNKGILHMINDSEGQRELEAWRKYRDSIYPAMKKKQDALYNKMFKKYGLRK